MFPENVMVPTITIAEIVSKNIARLTLTMSFPFNLKRIIVKSISPRNPLKMQNSSTNLKSTG
jgi:hypothetical protein